jgi:hypothetical protein
MNGQKHKKLGSASENCGKIEPVAPPVEAAVFDDPQEFAKFVFKAAQRPALWLHSAERLRDAAEAILKHELPAEGPYFQALKIAGEEAAGNDTGVADITAVQPNYPPAQLMYAYAIENVLKGLIVSMQPDLIQEDKLARELTSNPPHNLMKFAEKAKFEVDDDERRVLGALSQLAMWAGRYPVALTREEFAGMSADDLLDYGSDHPIMRRFFERAHRELESRLPPLNRFGVVVIT